MAFVLELTILSSVLMLSELVVKEAGQSSMSRLQSEERTMAVCLPTNLAEFSRCRKDYIINDGCTGDFQDDYCYLKQLQ